MNWKMLIKLQKSEADAIAMASMLHYDIMTINEVRNFTKINKLNVGNMNKNKIIIVDYGMGNILSVQRAENIVQMYFYPRIKTRYYLLTS